MTVTSLDAAADLAADEAASVLADQIVDSVKFTAAALAGALDGGAGGDAELLASLTAPRSYRDLWAMVLLLADCADKAKTAAACGINPGLAAANAKRMAEARHKQAEYIGLRVGGVSPEAAGERVGLVSTFSFSEYEAAYQQQKRQREGSAA